MLVHLDHNPGLLYPARLNIHLKSLGKFKLPKNIEPTAFNLAELPNFLSGFDRLLRVGRIVFLYAQLEDLNC